jgi:hypothetical protein
MLIFWFGGYFRVLLCYRDFDNRKNNVYTLMLGLWFLNHGAGCMLTTIYFCGCMLLYYGYSHYLWWWNIIHMFMLLFGMNNSCIILVEWRTMYVIIPNQMLTIILLMFVFSWLYVALLRLWLLIVVMNIRKGLIWNLRTLKHFKSLGLVNPRIDLVMNHACEWMFILEKQI